MLKAITRTMSVALCAAVTASACATGTSRIAPAYIGQPGTTSRSVLVDYVQRLPPGTPVRVNRGQGQSVRGTLMKATDQTIFLQPKTRLPEGIVEIPVDDVLAVTPEPTSGNSLGRAIGAGAAAGAAATVAIFLIIIAVAGD